MPTSIPLPSRSRVAPLLTALVVWTLASALTPWLGVWGGVGGAALSLGVGFALFYPKDLEPLFRCRLLQVVQGLAAGGMMIAATYLLFPVAGGLFPALPLRTRELYHLFNSGPAVFRLLLPFVIVGEELVWRGVVQGLVARRLGPFAAAGITAVIYGAAHVPVNPLLAGVALCCGLYWGLLRARTGSLIPSLIAHLMWDLLVMVWLPLAR